MINPARNDGLRGVSPPAFLLSLLLLFLIGGRALAVSDFYWEYPSPITSKTSRFPVAASAGGVSAVAWQESVAGDDGGGVIRVSLAVRGGEDADWRIYRDVAGPYSYAGTEPVILSLAVDAAGRVLLAANASSGVIDMCISADMGESFSRTRIENDAGVVSPRLFVAADGSYLLFATGGQDQSLSILYSRSVDGLGWSPFMPLIDPGEGLRLNFLPSHASVGDEDFVVFQSLVSGTRPSYQLYFKRSTDGGKTWDPAVLVTAFNDPLGGSRPGPENFDNQRPSLAAVEGALFLAWERRSGAGSPQIYVAELDRSGKLVGEADRASGGSAYCNNPVVFSYEGEPTIVWFDNRKGQDRIFLAQRNGILWEDQDISGSGGTATFARPMPAEDGLYVCWQSASRGQERIFLLKPDRSVQAPKLAAVDFKEGKRIRRDFATLSWTAPDDSSGIIGYSYSWSQDPDEVPPEELQGRLGDTKATRVATEDGSWYFSIRAQDYAGNWSPPSTIEFFRDTTAPGGVNVVLPPVDAEGFLDSNTFTLRWNPPPASDIVGYTYSLEYLAPLDYLGVLERNAAKRDLPFEFVTEASAALHPPAPPRKNLGADLDVSFTNRDDGIWAFSVAAIDEVGNIGPATVSYFRTNKYVPYTYITYARSSVDDFGVLTLRIIGRGFSDGGEVTRVFLDRDGRPPYDREFLLDRGDFRVESDRSISGLRIEDLEVGRYRIGLDHPLRGVYLSAPLISVDEYGTVKFGDYSQSYDGSWKEVHRRPWRIDMSFLLMLALVAFAAVAFIASLRGLAGVAREGMQIKLEVAALITGDMLPMDKKLQAGAKLRRRGAGLRLKLVAFTTVLVVMVVALVSAPLMYFMTLNQEAILVRGLKDRSRVLLESLASGARAYLPAKNLLELGFLPAQVSAMPEAKYATITGMGEKATVFADHVWASNDPDIASKIDTSEYKPGVSRLVDALSPRLESIAKDLDEKARSEVGSLSAGIVSLTQEGISLALKTDQASIRRRDDIQAETRALESRLNEKLAELSSSIGSEPSFDEDRLPEGATSFVFYKPVMYRQGSEDQFFRGLVRIEVTTDLIVAEIATAQRNLFYITGTVALVAILIGIVGVLILSSLIVRPLKRLVSHVEMIRDTENKEELAGVDIVVKSKDEIAVLGDTINDMTHGLVKAAMANKDLTVGKEVQKMFIPLETDNLGRKLTSGHTDAARAEFFGYYEGAKGVSGDYFDYVKLDERYFAIIKCDIAGKGVPAALIMIEVATLFLDHFKNWKPSPDAFKLDRLVYRINELLESRGFKGRFAAFTLCLFDSKTGLIRFCNAGDNLVHYYSASESKMKLLTFPESPTAGVFPNDLIELKGGYSVQTHKLGPGDILLLYTDGIEEAQRHFRNASLDVTPCAESDGPETTNHLNHTKGEEVELLGYERVVEIVDAVLAKDRYELVKCHAPDPEERFTFDFSHCDGSVEDAIMALVSVEKVFRMYRDPKAGDAARVLVDKKVDEFLARTFDQYRSYSAFKKDHGEFPEYIYYTRIREDEQYDDLTILGIRQK